MQSHRWHAPDMMLWRSNSAFLSSLPDASASAARLMTLTVVTALCDSSAAVSENSPRGALPGMLCIKQSRNRAATTRDAWHQSNPSQDRAATAQSCGSQEACDDYCINIAGAYARHGIGSPWPDSWRLGAGMC